MPSLIESDGDAFEILALLGQGGMGTVYKARQRSLDRVVALKMLNLAHFASPQSLQRLKREAIAAASIAHPNVVKVFSLHQATQQPFIVMEYVEGRSLDDLLGERGTVAPSEAIALFSQILDALECIHQAGLVHRDIKPSNIIVTAGGAAKLMDFGIAKHLDDLSTQQRLTQTGAAVGSPWFMSPEQCAGSPVDARSDIYSLACTMYQALSGRPPFGGDNPLEVMFKHLHEQAETLGGFASPRLSEVIAKALAKEKGDRHATAADFKAELQSCLNDDAPRKTRRSKKRKGAKQIPRPLVATGAGVLSLILVAGALYFFFKGPLSVSPASEHIATSIPDVPAQFIVPSLLQIDPKPSASYAHLLAKRARQDFIDREGRIPPEYVLKQKQKVREVLSEGLLRAEQERDVKWQCELIRDLTSYTDDVQQRAALWRQVCRVAEDYYKNDARELVPIYTSALEAQSQANQDAEYEKLTKRALDLLDLAESGPAGKICLADIRWRQINHLKARGKPLTEIENFIRMAIKENEENSRSQQQASLYNQLVYNLQQQKRYSASAAVYEEMARLLREPTEQAEFINTSLRESASYATDAYASIGDRRRCEETFEQVIQLTNLSCGEGMINHWQLNDALSCEYSRQALRMERNFRDRKTAESLLRAAAAYARRSTGWPNQPSYNACDVVYSLAGQLFRNAKFGEALAVAKEAEQAARTAKLPYFICHSLYIQGVSHFQMKEYADAERELLAARALADKNVVLPVSKQWIEKYLAYTRKELAKK